MKKSFVVSALLAGISTLFAGSINDILANKKVRIGVMDHSAPFSKVGTNGNWEGFEIDFSKELVKRMFPEDEIELEFVKVAGKERMDVVLDNKVDMLIAGYARTDARAEKADFSLPYLSTTLAMVTKKSDAVTNMGQLAGKNVAVIPNSNSEILLNEEKLVNVVQCANNKECLDMLNSGQADAYMHNLNNAAMIPLLDNKYEVSIPMIGEGLVDCVMVQKGNPELIAKIDNVILELANEGYFANEYDKTFEPFYRGAVKREYFILDDFYEAFNQE